MEHDHIIVFSGNTHCDKIGEKVQYTNAKLITQLFQSLKLKKLN